MSHLSPDQWEQIRDLFESLCDQAPDSWEKELADREVVVRERVLAMLRSQSDQRLADSAAEQAPALLQNNEGSRIGQRVDRFELTALLGAGGMGEVYSARRVSGDYEQTVAVKLLASPLGDFVARFERERQLLAQLEHPHIARLLDGGTTEQGIPYLVMEFVDGLPIDRYCDYRELILTDRVVLALQVIKAVAFAHSRLVLHRDIKAANVLVDSQGQTRLMDFGIATLLDATGQAEATRSGVLTPTAAAPEQLRGERTTAATDVFQLGLLIYRMLTGRHPFDHSTNGDGSSLTKQLLELEPIPLSRLISPQAIPRRRDLEAILAKSLAVDPQDRYRSAADLHDDFEAWRSGRPVRARPLTAFRLSMRWAARNPLASGALLAAVVSLVLGSGIATWQALEANRQLQETQRSATEANQVADFLARVFQSSNSFESQGIEPTASELLAAGVESIESELAEQPLVQARLLVTMGVTYRSRSEFDTAAELLSQAIELIERSNGAPENLALALSELAWVNAYRGNFDEARQRLIRALEQLGPLKPAHSEERGKTLQRLAIVEINRQDMDAADQRLTEALAEFKTQRPVDPESLASVLSLQGSVAYGRDDFEGALAAYEAALPATREALGDEHHSVALTIANIATVRYQLKEYDSAADLYLEAISINEAFFGQKDHLQIASSWRGLAKAYQELGEFELSVQAFQNSLDIWSSRMGEAHIETQRVRAELAEFLWLLGRFDEAVDAQADAPSALLESRELDLACLGRALILIRDWHLGAVTTRLAIDCANDLPTPKRWRVGALAAITDPPQRADWSALFTGDEVSRSPLFTTAEEMIVALADD